LIEPIDLDEYDLILTSDNFLAEVQEEVEAGKDKAAGEPKRILKVLAPLVIDRLVDLSDSQRLVLRDLVAYHIQTRDIMAYINNSTLESYIQKMGLGGEVLDLSDEENIDYLAVVNANIAGHKTDALIDQAINLESQISSDGQIANLLTIQRSHSGNKKMEWWYSAVNKNYLTVLTPTGSVVRSADGQITWPKMPKYDYTGYETDGDLEEISSSLEFLSELDLESFVESNRQAFAAWVYTDVGETSAFDLEYDLARSLDLGRDVIPFRFIFERQSGVKTSLAYQIEAPDGFYWVESGGKVFQYQDADPAGRVILDLTLQKTKVSR